ncbi:MAG: response regulator [Alphaproteobacteria bacterium]|nr:response regulator [Alphaproteobacteria bacterium]MCK5554681.1 response regulator [Alphaproteobacteria bacterium]
MTNIQEQISSLSGFAQKSHILVVDDDERLRTLLSRFLTENDFLVTTAIDSEDARQKLKSLQYDLIVMDVMMPGVDGLELTQSLKAEKLMTPVLLLTALGEIESRIQGLEAGADDYIAKPFEPRELLLRIYAILRRIAIAPVVKSEVIRFGKWTLDFDRGELFDDSERLPLTQVEHTLLKALSGRKGEVVGREELAQLCKMDSAERTIDVQITRLRKKLEEDPKLPKYIQTVRGKGYILWPDT